jgi:hypothetical protein
LHGPPQRIYRQSRPRSQQAWTPHADPRTVNLFIRVQPSGVKSFVTVARGKQRWITIARTDHLGIDATRAASVEIVARSKQACRTRSVADIVDPPLLTHPGCYVSPKTSLMCSG